MEPVKDKDKALTALETLTTEVVYRAVFKVCGHHFTIDRVVAIAEPLAAAVVEMVISQGMDEPYCYDAEVENYISFELMCSIVDEVAKEIPVADNIGITAKVNRVQRRFYLDEYTSGEGAGDVCPHAPTL